MESKLVKLKSDFNDIINIRNKVKNIFDILQIRIDRLTQIYSEFIKTNKNEMSVFGLDSFHFQSKLIDIEYDDMKRLFLAINNRMYCEYFKLHKIIVEYISKNITDKKISDLVKINNFPVYKDLEPFKEYKFETILDIHENILNLLGILMALLNNKENELSIHKTKQNIGLNIDNFITSFNFNINVMREKIMMFITYIEFFHKMHSKYLKRFSNKIQLMYTHISNDIKFDDSVEISKDKKKELIDEFVTHNMDKELLKDFKTSIGSETNSEASSEVDGTKNSFNSSEMVKSPSLLSLSIPSPINPINPINMINKNKSNSSFNIPTLSKTNYKSIFKNNVHKVTDMIGLCKKKDNIVEPKMSEKDIEEIFYKIEESCDTIINQDKMNEYAIEPENIGLHINSFDEARPNTPLHFEGNDLLHVNGENGENEVENTIIEEQEEVVIQEKEEEMTIKEEVDMTIKEEDTSIQEEEKVEAEIKYEAIFDEEELKNDDISNDEAKNIENIAPKKKRTYNKKKK
jgi:hypothetical protein